MTPPAMIPCERCQGIGRTPRIQRRRADGSPDPFDVLGQHREICDRCGGSGEVPADRPPASGAASVSRPISAEIFRLGRA